MKNYLIIGLFVLLTACDLMTARQQSEEDGQINWQEMIKKKENTATSAEQESLRIATWNLYNFGKSKDNQEIAYIAQQLRHFDLVAIQEVSIGESGAQAVARLADALNRKGAKWDYSISPPTNGKGQERYAYLWKSAKVRLKSRTWLVKKLDKAIDREPYMARFETRAGNRLLLANFHAVPRSKDPENEIVLLDELHKSYTEDNLMVMGDFNLSQKHKAFDALKKYGYSPCIQQQKTSIKMKVKNKQKLANEYDNIFIESKVFRMDDSGVVPFYEDFHTLKSARKISDHIPVWVKVRFRN